MKQTVPIAHCTPKPHALKPIWRAYGKLLCCARLAYFFLSLWAAWENSTFPRRRESLRNPAESRYRWIRWWWIGNKISEIACARYSRRMFVPGCQRKQTLPARVTARLLLMDRLRKPLIHLTRDTIERIARNSNEKRNERVEAAHNPINISINTFNLILLLMRKLSRSPSDSLLLPRSDTFSQSPAQKICGRTK